MLSSAGKQSNQKLPSIFCFMRSLISPMRTNLVSYSSLKASPLNTITLVIELQHTNLGGAFRTQQSPKFYWRERSEFSLRLVYAFYLI